MDYLPRTIDDELDDILDHAPAVAIDGPKGVGKSASAMRRADRAWYLDDPDQLAQLAADPTFAAAPAGTLLIDEWQRRPEVWDSVRRRVDEGAPPGRFVLTGSASPLPPGTTHSGAGRILSLRMRPMAFHERGDTRPSVSLSTLLADGGGDIAGSTDLTVADYYQAICTGGFPGISRGPERIRRQQLDAYIARVVDHDIPELGHSIRRPETLRRWLAAYAAASSSTTSLAKIADAAAGVGGTPPPRTTTTVYRDLLSRLWLLDPVDGWTHSRRPLTRVQQAPKHQLADPALAARLLNLRAGTLAGPQGAPMAGPLFESLATLTVRVAAQAADARVGHLRSRNGDREVDLVVEGSDGQVVGIEVKLAATVGDNEVRHLHWLRDQLPEEVVDLMVITTGTTAYRRADGIVVVPLALLGP